MPGWHDATQAERAAGSVAMVGILQEQHPRRAQLFMQWKGMDWPLLVDSLNLLGVEVVPITVFVDGHGIVRRVGPQVADLAGFLETDFEPPEALAPAPRLRPAAALKQAVSESAGAQQPGAWVTYGQHLVTWGQPADFEPAIDAFREALKLDPENAPAHFQLGVAYRKRYDSTARQTADFQHAVDSWSRALELEPNQYIWRRRIQQYGPRLAKPYPFYDWVETARSEIEARGEVPVELDVEPAGSELAEPAETLIAGAAVDEPDPEGRIRRDEGFVRAEQVVVPAAVEPGGAVRAHFVFRPDTSNQAHWNNEAEDLKLWIDPPEGWSIDQPSQTVANPRQLVSQETRRLEVELRSSEGHAAGPVTIPAYALYYVCEDVQGTCLYRRQDLDFEVVVR